MIAASEERTIEIENSLYDVELSNHGGVVHSWKLKKYLDDQKNAARSGYRESKFVRAARLAFFADALRSATGDASQHGAVSDHARHRTYRRSGKNHHALEQWASGCNEDTELRHVLRNDPGGGGDAGRQKPIPCAVAWRGGFGDKAVIKASQLVSVFYKTNGKLSLLQYKKLGVVG